MQYADSDDWAVFNPDSANIHQLSSAARRLFDLAATGVGAAPEALATRLAHESGHPLDSTFIDATRETLAFLDDAGLLVPVSPDDAAARPGQQCSDD